MSAHEKDLEMELFLSFFFSSSFSLNQPFHGTDPKPGFKPGFFFCHKFVFNIFLSFLFF